MIKGIIKLFVFFIKLTVAVAVIMMLLSVWHALDDGTRQAGNVLWRIICAIGHDFWIVGARFFHQCSENFGMLADGAKDDHGFNPFRWFIGGPTYFFIAILQTCAWWLSHGSTPETIVKVLGTAVLCLLLMAYGNIGLGGGGGGGGGGGSKGGGHH